MAHIFRLIISTLGISWVIISFFLEYYHEDNPFTPGLFSSSGAILLCSAIILNIKNISFNIEQRYKESGHLAMCASPLSTSEKNKRFLPMILDNIFEVILMVIGTLIWAYGNLLMLFIKLGILF